MKKYAIPAALFLFNNEVISWAALCIIGFIFVIDFYKEVATKL